VDPEHQLVTLFGFVNIPYGLWVNEDGIIVRPADVAFGPRQERPADATARTPEQEEQRRQLQEAQRRAQERMTPEQRELQQKMFSSIDRSGRYVEAVRDWVENGEQSRYVLSPQQVIERSRPRPIEAAMASAQFDLGQHLHRAGYGLDAVAHFKEAQRLDPTNWMYFRQANAIADREWHAYEWDMMSIAAEVGPESFYPALDL
jgi:hypothetical protein